MLASELVINLGNRVVSLHQECIREKDPAMRRAVRGELTEARKEYSLAKKEEGLKYFDHDVGEWVGAVQ